MKSRFTALTRFALLCGLGFILASCLRKDEPNPAVQDQPLNSFKTLLNGQPWQPTKIGEDECKRAFHGAWSAIIQNGMEKPYFTINAFKDAQGRTTYQSENFFYLQITNVQKVGTYGITGTYRESLDSYALFGVNKADGTYVRYINRSDRPAFVVEVGELTPNSQWGLFVRNIKATFYGTLYNEANPLDSLTFSRGSFSFAKPNWYKFDQCAE